MPQTLRADHGPQGVAQQVQRVVAVAQVVGGQRLGRECGSIELEARGLPVNPPIPHLQHAQAKSVAFGWVRVQLDPVEQSQRQVGLLRLQQRFARQDEDLRPGGRRN